MMNSVVKQHNTKKIRNPRPNIVLSHKLVVVYSLIMDIYVLIEPLYEDSLWCRKYLEGLKYEAGRNSISLVFIKSSDDCVPSENGICALLGSTPQWIGKMSADLARDAIRCIVVNPDCSVKAGMTSQIHIDFHKAMQMVASYFTTHHRNHTVLFGVNPSSTTDELKAQAFRTAFPTGTVSMNEGSVSQNCGTLLQRYPSVDSVLCCNELVAIALLRQLQHDQRAIPQDIWLLTFGRSALSQHFKPSLSAIEVDHMLVGRQIIKIAQILLKNPVFSTLCCTIDANIIPAETTDNASLKFSHLERTEGNQAFENSMNFYQDPIIKELGNLDRLFSSILPSDLILLQGVANNKKYAEIAENLGMSENAIKYRMKRMMGLAEVEHRYSLLSLLERYLGEDWVNG